jgi:cell division FtsZ-interacting protein ZapD
VAATNQPHITQRFKEGSDMSSIRKKLAGDKPEMPPRTIMVGDRVRVKKEMAPMMRNLCTLAGWTVNTDEIRTIYREDSFGAGGRKRLFVEGAPYCFDPSTVELAWNSPEERRKALIEAGSWAPSKKAA